MPVHRPKRLCIITTSAVSLVALHRGLYPYFRSQDWEITTISGPGDEYLNKIRAQNVNALAMPLVRQPAPLTDLWCLIRLWVYFLRHRFDVIHVSTPKAGLIGMLAAWLSGHRKRVFTCRGRAFENFQGVKRRIFLAMDHLICRLAWKVIPICQELGQVLVTDRTCRQDKIAFIGASSNGVDTHKFVRSEQVRLLGMDLRGRLGISSDSLVILSMGRVRAEKGINELVRAFKDLVAPEGKVVHLVLVGPEEPVDPLDPAVKELIKNDRCIHTPGESGDPVPWYAMADLVAFPSYREGFGNIAIEAAAMELPVVASDIMGCREGVLDGKTGILVPKGSPGPLAKALQRLINSPELRTTMGRAGRKRVEDEFQPKSRWDAILKIYMD